MDDIATIVSHVQARWISDIMDNVATWVRMFFKARKSRSMMIKVISKFVLQVQGEVMPPIEDNPIKCPGKWFNASLADGAGVTNAVKQTEEWLKKIGLSGLPGKFKTWLYQRGLLPSLLWLFTVYEFPIFLGLFFNRGTRNDNLPVLILKLNYIIYNNLFYN